MSLKQPSMAPKAAAEEHNNTETAENTLIQQKKKSRRVSFAETTCVHLFDRDEEYETPPEPEHGCDDRNSPAVDGFRFFSDKLKGSSLNDEETDIDGEDNQDEDFNSRKSFLRPIESPSPGSTIGSAATNEEDNFFGPVSASFIRPGRLSDSAASNENHDITMDSTAFSMHFRSLARSDSGVDLETPIGVDASFEEKTPIHTSRGSSMVLTTSKKPILNSFVEDTKSSAFDDSNDMSLEGEKPHQYDYGRLSPGLDALLAEGSRNLLVVSDVANIDTSKPSENEERKSSSLNRVRKTPVEPIGNPSKELDRSGTPNILTDTVRAVHDKTIVLNGVSRASPIRHLTYDILSTVSNPEASDLSNIQANQSHRHFENDMLVERNMEPVKDSSQLRQSDMHISAESRKRASPVKGFTSSSSKQRKTLDSSPSRHATITPPGSRTYSFLSNEKMLHAESVSSVQKSISRLNKLEASPLSSTFSELIQKFQPSNYLPKTPPFGIILPYNRDYPDCKDAFPATTNKNSLRASHSKEMKRLMKTRDNGIQRSKNEEDVGDSNGYDGQYTPLHHMDTGSISPKAIQVSKEDSLPSQRAFSGKKIQTNLIGSDINCDKKVIGSPCNLIPSPELGSKIRQVESPKHQGSLRRDFSSINKNAERLNSDPSLDSTATIDKLDPVCMVGKKLFTNDIAGVGDHQDESGVIGNHNFQDDKSLFMSGNNLSDRGIEVARFGSSPSSLLGMKNKPPLPKNLVVLFDRSPSRNMLHGLTNNEDLYPANVDAMPSPKSTHLTNESGNNSTLKRKIEEIVANDGDYIQDLVMLQKNPKVQKSGSFHSELLACQSVETSTDRGLLHWVHSYSNLSEDVEKFFPPNVYKLNLHEIHALENILVHLQRLKTYEMLSVQSRSQKSVDLSNPHQHHGSCEVAFLFQNLVHELAKLQLMRIKKEKLQKRLQVLSCGIQEFDHLKLNSLPSLPVPSKRTEKIDDLRSHTFPTNLGDKHQVIRDQLMEREQVLESSERKISSLTKSLQITCKLKGEASSVDTIAFVNDLTKKRMCCRAARLGLQLWLVDSLESRNGHHNIVVNYLDFLSQRLSVKIAPVSTIGISNELNTVNIVKNYPNIGARTAFAFVLNKEIKQKYGGPRNLRQEIQKTSSLLGNLLDVVEEVQLAKAELRNLFHANFHSPFVDQLDLKLCFLDLKNGIKALLTFDISCLNRGVYPSELIPSQLAVSNVGKEETSQSLLAELDEVIENLQAGHLRIIRLCRCISKVVQVLTFEWVTNL